MLKDELHLLLGFIRLPTQKRRGTWLVGVEISCQPGSRKPLILHTPDFLENFPFVLLRAYVSDLPFCAPFGTSLIKGNRGSTWVLQGLKYLKFCTGCVSSIHRNLYSLNLKQL